MQTFHLVLLVSILLTVVSSTLFSLVLALIVFAFSSVIIAVAMPWLRRRYDGVGIVHPELYIKLDLLELGHFPWLVHKFSGHVFQFGQPESHIVTVLVVVLTLLDNIETIQSPTRQSRR